MVTREDLLVEVSRLCREFDLEKVSKVVVGGKERIYSVQAGLAEVRQDAELIAIHDGARPLLPPRGLAGGAGPGDGHRSGGPGHPGDRHGQAGGGGRGPGDAGPLHPVCRPDPQVFQADLIRAAIHQAAAEGAVLTDDCAAVERLGMKVSLTRGSRENLKLTTPFDLVVGEAILDARERGEL